MSDNKMGGVPPKTREALYRFFRAMKTEDDAVWAEIITTMTVLGPVETKQKMND